MAEKQQIKFLKLPQTRLGWWAVGLSLLFTVLFLSILSGLRFSGMLTGILGILSAVLGLVTILWKGERSWLVWLMLLPGLFAIVNAVAEVLYLH